MRSLKNKKDDESVKELSKVVEAIAESAENNFKKVKDELSKLKTDEGKLNQRQLETKEETVPKPY